MFPDAHDLFIPRRAPSSSLSSSGANPTLGHGCPNETTPGSPILHSVPGGEKANVDWFQVSPNSAGSRVCQFPSSPLPVPRLTMNGSVQSTAVIQIWAGPSNMPEPVEPSGGMISDSGRQPVRQRSFAFVTY